ncbi:hypothetical protein GQ600_17804 [Phytophthora cactorum]|nr:hypothetical protein GQ600_17804 [Phytophthora cactorum]
MQEKVKLQQQERKHLTTQLAMEKSLDEIYQSTTATRRNGRRAPCCASLEQDYASLIDQELELKRDCEVLELQLGTQQAQLEKSAVSSSTWTSCPALL